MSNAAFNAWIDYRDSHPDEEHPDYEILDEVADWCGRRVEDLDAEIARLKAEIDRVATDSIALVLDRGEALAEVALLRGLLRDVEWVDAAWSHGECPICARRRYHAPDCRLAAALEKDHG
jgi:hypothetical protein